MRFRLIEEQLVVLVHAQCAAIDQKHDEDSSEDCPDDQQHGQQRHSPPRLGWNRYRTLAAVTRIPARPKVCERIIPRFAELCSAPPYRVLHLVPLWTRSKLARSTEAGCRSECALVHVHSGPGLVSRMTDRFQRTLGALGRTRNAKRASVMDDLVRIERPALARDDLHQVLLDP